MQFLKRFLQSGQQKPDSGAQTSEYPEVETFRSLIDGKPVNRVFAELSVNMDNFGQDLPPIRTAGIPCGTDTHGKPVPCLCLTLRRTSDHLYLTIYIYMNEEEFLAEVSFQEWRSVAGIFEERQLINSSTLLFRKVLRRKRISIIRGTYNQTEEQKLLREFDPSFLGINIPQTIQAIVDRYKEISPKDRFAVQTTFGSRETDKFYDLTEDSI